MNENVRNSIQRGCSLHPDKVQNFIADYVGDSFGIMPKSEIDINFFMLLQEIGVINMNPTNFEVVQKLRVTTSKARKLIYAAALRRTDESTIKDEILNLMCSPRIPVDGKDLIVIEIDNPLLADHIKAQLRQWQEGTDGMLNSNALKLTLNGYNKLLFSLFDEHLAEQSLEATGDELYQYYTDIQREDTTVTKLQKVISYALNAYRENASVISATITLLKEGASLVKLFM